MKNRKIHDSTVNHISDGDQWWNSKIKIMEEVRYLKYWENSKKRSIDSSDKDHKEYLQCDNNELYQSTAQDILVKVGLNGNAEKILTLNNFSFPFICENSVHNTVQSAADESTKKKKSMAFNFFIYCILFVIMVFTFSVFGEAIFYGLSII